MIEIRKTDALELLQSIETDSVDLVVTDPPYYRIKDLEWDKQWKTQTEYLAWLEQIIAESKRILKPNGSFYMFASNKMATNIDILISNYMQVKNNIVWFKETGFHNRICTARQRSYFPAMVAPRNEIKIVLTVALVNLLSITFVRYWLSLVLLNHMLIM